MRRILLRDLHLTFQELRRGSLSVKDLVMHKAFGRPLPPMPVVEAIKGVSFEVHDGERLGIIGHNGAGKSTLLRVLAGVYKPTSGECVINGHISSLFELQLGFESDATGRENIRYRGYLQKETPATIEAKMKSIEEFTDLGPALDMPIKYYSSGMLVRLAFSIATSVDPEVLLIDEVLAAGDMGFQEKARGRMRELMSRAKAMVVVSHDLAAIMKMCDRVLWLHRGQIRMIGTPGEVVAAYSMYMRELYRKPAA